MQSISPVALLALTLLCLWGCSDPSYPARARIASVEVSPAVDTVRTIGGSLHLHATARDRGGNALPGLRPRWRSSDPAVVGVDSSGIATAVGNGSADVVAVFDTVTGAAHIVVDARGTLRLHISTTGGGVDPDGYSVYLGDERRRVTGTDTLVVWNLRPGVYRVFLVDLARHCWTGHDRADIAIGAGDTLALEFHVRCTGRYAFTRWYGTGGNELRYMDEFGNDYLLVPEPIALNSYRWSPDGSRIVVSREVGGNTDLYVVQADGSSVVRLTEQPQADGAASWSPDGRRIAFRSTAQDGTTRLWTIRADGSDLRPLLGSALGRDASGPEWSPRGDRIVFSGSMDGMVPGHLWSIAPDGSGLRSLADAGVDNRTPVWSPDGTRLAFERVIAHEGSELVVSNDDGTDQRVIVRSERGTFNPAWSPDGRRLAFVDYAGDAYGVHTVNADGTGETSLTPQFWYAGDPAWTLDGRHILFMAIPRYLGTIVVMEPDASGVQELLWAPPDQGGPRPRPR